MNRRDLPAVNTVKNLPQVATLADECGDAYVTSLIRAEIDRCRTALQRGAANGSPTAESIARAVVQQVQRNNAQPIPPVLNATGVIVHTNLGRAALAPDAVHALQDAASHPAAVELDLATGKRGHRDRLVEAVLCELTGAEAATVVNNNAAAVLLALDTLAKGREVILSRGELVEIGGSFRIPDVLVRSGAHLVEVGTTNKTRIGDYAQAITPATALLMKVHSSNFRTVGFTEEASREELAALAHRHHLTVVEDLGSGAFVDLRPAGITQEPLVTESVAAGIDVVTFSGDKLLGGPQAGIIVGKRDAVDAMRTNPLMRALRPGKLTLAPLVATLRLYRHPERAQREIPVLHAIHRSADEVRAQADTVAAALADTAALTVRVAACDATVGGGAAPGLTLPSTAVVLTHANRSADALAQALRDQSPAVLARVADDALWLDQRTIPAADVPTLIARIRAAAA